MASPAAQLRPNPVSHCHAHALQSATLHRRNHCFSGRYLSSSPSPSPSPSSSSSSSSSSSTISINIPHPHLHVHLHIIDKRHHGPTLPNAIPRRRGCGRGRSFTLAFAKSDSDASTSLQEEEEEEEEEEEGNGERPARLYDPDQEEDVANCEEILRVLEILKDKRDMPFNEVRLTIMIEDPREEERREEFAVENERGCSREDMAAALVDVYEGRIPSDRLVLRELTKEMISWPNLEDELEDSPSNATVSPYAQTTDTGVDPRIKAQRLKVDWDEAAEIQPGEESDDPNVPPVVGFSVLYLVSAIPIIIGAAVVAILYSNSFR